MTTHTGASATPSSTRADFVRVSARGFTVVRNILVQVPDGNNWVGSSLGRLVEARQPRALLAYLLLLMSWSAVDKRAEPLEAGVWSRALSPDPPAPPWAPAAMSRVWNTLEEHRLIERERQGRLIRVSPRREDGRKAYSRPRPDETNNPRERYFILPDAFWTDGWHAKLGLPGVAALLIVLQGTSARDEARLPYERAPRWYGISPKTLQTGLEELRANGLLTERREWVAESFSAIGRTQHVYYAAAGAFARQERQRLQKEAAKATKARTAKAQRAAKRRPRVAKSGTGA